MRTACGRQSLGARVRPIAAGLVLALLLIPGGRALAADQVVARDTHITFVLALDGVVVYGRSHPAGPPFRRPWMRVVNGRVLPARAMNRRRSGAYAGATSIGLDANGRVVVPFSRSRYGADGKLLFRRWFIYDVVADRARPFRGLPGNLNECSEIAIWRSRLAYSTCDHAYLRVGRRTRRVPIPPRLAWWWGGGSGRLVLRGATLFGQVSDFSDGIFPSLLADASGFCKLAVPGLNTGEGNVEDFWPLRRYLTWSTRAALVGARLRGQCRTPEPAGLFFTVPPGNQVMAVDDRFAYYGDFKPETVEAKTIRRHLLPSRPLTAPPANDNFENATPLSGDAPLSTTVVIGTATTQAGEPPVTPGSPSAVTRTVWYAFRPSRSGPVRLSYPGDEHGSGYFLPYAIFTGATLTTLTRVTDSGSFGNGRPLDAVAGQTYWIAVGAEGLPLFDPVTLKLQPAAG